MIIKSASFLQSNTNVAKLPKADKPEYAFIGRSNVGKSSLINMLTGNNKLAKVSATPGKTITINHFIINNEWYLVDLPGYGYARTSKTTREKWGKMIREYLLQREQLTNVFVLVDSRIPTPRIDIEFINFLGQNGVPLTIVFTKTDKESQRVVMGNIRQMKQELSEVWGELPPMLLTSSATGVGRDALLDQIMTINENLKA